MRTLYYKGKSKTRPGRSSFYLKLERTNKYSAKRTRAKLARKARRQQRMRQG